MDNNEFLRRVRYALQIDDAEAARLIQLAGGLATTEQARAWRVKVDDPAFELCSDAALNALLDGLIADRRGAPASAPQGSVWPAQRGAAGTSPVTAKPAGPPASPGRAVPVARGAENNSRLKQLRIALMLRSDDVQELMTLGGATISANEVAAVFRKPGTRNFRRCGDQLLRQFLSGLASRRSPTTHTDLPSHER